MEPLTQSYGFNFIITFLLLYFRFVHSVFIIFSLAIFLVFLKKKAILEGSMRLLSKF